MTDRRTDRQSLYKSFHFLRYKRSVEANNSSLPDLNFVCCLNMLKRKRSITGDSAKYNHRLGRKQELDQQAAKVPTEDSSILNGSE